VGPPTRCVVVGGENALRGDMEAVLGAGCRGVHKQMGSLPRQPDPSHRSPVGGLPPRSGGKDFGQVTERAEIVHAESLVGVEDPDDLFEYRVAMEHLEAIVLARLGVVFLG
jgi:hypothetical protein